MMNQLKRVNAIQTSDKKKLTLTHKLVKLKKIADRYHSNKYITTQEFNNFALENFAARLA